MILIFAIFFFFAVPFRRARANNIAIVLSQFRADAVSIVVGIRSLAIDGVRDDFRTGRGE
jgi:hypothetical protein